LDAKNNPLYFFKLKKWIKSKHAGTRQIFLSTIIGKPVSVKLNSGIEYRGILACLDGYMNIALEQTKEYVNGLQKNDYGDAFIRGNNGEPSKPYFTNILVLYISAIH
ncbi:U4/U6-U5 snRNP complex subunit lsm6, partial [Entomophthora muscae]